MVPTIQSVKLRLIIDTSPDLRSEVKLAMENLLPVKSKEKYKRVSFISLHYFEKSTIYASAEMAIACLVRVKSSPTARPSNSYSSCNWLFRGLCNNTIIKCKIGFRKQNQQCTYGRSLCKQRVRLFIPFLQNTQSNVYLSPKVIVEMPRRLPAPVSITNYNPPKPIYEHSPTVQYAENTKKSKVRKKIKIDVSLLKSINFCRWYKRRKALKDLTKEKEKENKRERKRLREEFEQERMKDFVNWELAKARTQSLPPPPKKKTVIVKERSASAQPKPIPTAKPKPRVHSKYVTVKKLDRKNSISVRFVNYCYRFCCQLYCYLTSIILVVLIFFV